MLGHRLQAEYSNKERGQEALFFFCLGGARALRAELRIIPHSAQFVKSFLKNFFKNYFSQKY
jgi:hypothetical protein